MYKMGRSKFPGKPSKHTHKTRINVLSAAVNRTVVDNNPVTVNENNSKKDEKNDKASANKLIEFPTVHKKCILSKKKNKKRRVIKSPAAATTTTTTTTPANKIASTRRNRVIPSNNTLLNNTISKVGRRSVINFTNHRKITKPARNENASSNTVGKFVLPTRSVRSSRVIKPNKRFIESPSTIKPSNSHAKQCSDKETIVDDSESQIKKPETPISRNKVVLRQARLQVSSKSTLSDGPFSSNRKTFDSVSDTLTCGVCCAVRVCRFKQVRKFNIYTCDSCRKFISKLIHRSNNDKNVTTPLNCHKGQGHCHVSSPIVRGSQWKYNRITSNSRCPACWLKLCLRNFQMPISLKTSLTQFLPKHMQLSISDHLFSCSLPVLTWQSELTTDLQETHYRQRSMRLKALNKQKKTLPVTNQVPNEIKRQKVDLKGPRVKHVCRSASIVLGQTPATFPIEKKVDIEPIEKPKLEIEVELAKDVEIVEENVIENTTNVVDVIVANIEEKSNKNVAVFNKRDKNKQLALYPLEITKPSFKKKTKKMPLQIETSNKIDLDYWETYDPDEVVCNGFSIISSEQFPMQTICFLCGSAGRETLLYCCICCEPYHPYCLEQGPPKLMNSNQKFLWICPKCSICNACGEADKVKVNCQKCHKAYHAQCFNNKWRTNDLPTVCSNCLRCKSCGTDNITKFVGNMALCLSCFKLRNKGNYCPICQCCYDDNDYDTKMMECGKCNKWVHAKCEGLSDEQYQILSILPESVEYICCLCSNQTTHYWRKAIQNELRSCFNNILRMLSKNRIARDMLKLSPIKSYSLPTKQLNSARRLEFVDAISTTDDDIQSSTSDSIDNDLEQVNTIFKNKIDFGDSFNSSNNELNDSKFPISPSMIDIKNKLNCNEYFSLLDFHIGMEKALKTAFSEELLKIYRSVLKKVFPWFDPDIKEDDEDSKVQQEKHCLHSNEEVKKFSYEAFDVQVSEKIDNRTCNLCKGIGDGLPQKEARLLYCGQNEWVHANCALWSSEVYEEIDGSLQNVHTAINRGRSIRCTYCKQKGASVGCCLKGCFESYHFPCAQKCECHFIADRSIYCKAHDISDKYNVITNAVDFEIRRAVYIEVDNKKRKRFCDRNKVNFMIGSLSVLSLGKIIPSVSDNADGIIPVGFVCSRLFWSTTEPWKLIPYKITTLLLNTQAQAIVDKNFTVDHNLSKHIVDKKLKEIALWQKDDREEKTDNEFDYYEEQQTTGDILSPELTDALLEDLPQDLLDGITVQDMLLGYEELLTMDFKNSEINCNDNLSLNMNNECEDNKPNRELRKSKTELIQYVEKPRNQQRSCSVTWLLDNSLSNSPAMKKRKLAQTRENIAMPILQVDGAYDSSGSECDSPIPSNTINENDELWLQEEQVGEEPVACEKCHCTYRTNASFKRHLESCEAMFTSESETEEALSTSYETTYSATSTTTTKSEAQKIHSTLMNAQTIIADSTKIQQNNSVIYNIQHINFNNPSNDVNSTQLFNQYCINQQQNLCLNQQNNLVSVDKGAITISPIISIDNSQVINTPVLNTVVDIQQQQQQQQPFTLQSIPFQQDDITPIINIAQQNQGSLTIDAKVLTPNVLNLPQNQWLRPVLGQAQSQAAPILNKVKQRQRIIAKKPKINSNTILLPNNSMYVQQLPSGNVLPIMEAPNMQYVTTALGPQLATQQLSLQLPDNNFLSIVPNVQPTMIIQQPRVDSGQVIVESNGTMMWATQPVQQIQPIYYGFETIVQNTVMQSQQFLPSPMPGVLTTNSSYSATTQVFQSKLEPVIDGSFVLVNPAINTLVNQQNALPLSQIQCTQPSISAVPKQITTTADIAPIKTSMASHHTTSNSITLPVAPFVPEQQGIPTNIVTPTPKQPSTTTQSRPMSRVLPMQTLPPTLIRPKIDVPAVKTDKVITILENVAIRQSSSVLTEIKNVTNEQASITLQVEEVSDLNDIKIIPDEKMKEVANEVLKSCNNNKVQIVPLKPIKSNQIALATVQDVANKENSSVIATVTIGPITDNNAKVNHLNDENAKMLPKLVKRTNKPQNTSIYFRLETADGVDYTAASLPQLWKKIINDVQSARLEHNLPPLPENALRTITDFDLLGLKTKGMRYLLEQFPETLKCKNYKPLFIDKTNDASKFDDDIDEDTTRRSIAYEIKREKYDMFGWLSSKHRTLEMYDLDSVLKKTTSTSLPMAMRFRALRITSKYSVGVYRSEIHGRGLFSLRDIEAGEMVIEYAGEVIRSVLTDKREKYYNSKGIGCYMFRIDDNLVVDATMKGNAARFINHSCDPNCYSKVVEILGHKHIIIFALRKILCGEELTYDYKFPFEEDKIPCTCGTKRCRKFLN